MLISYQNSGTETSCKPPAYANSFGQLMSLNIHKFDNGITLVGEKLDSVQSAAFSTVIPFGAASDPQGFEGSSILLTEMLSKGAGTFDSRELSQQFEEIGLHKNQNSGVQLSSISGALLGENLPRALDLLHVLISSPKLPAEELDNVRSLALQELMALEEEAS